MSAVLRTGTCFARTPTCAAPVSRSRHVVANADISAGDKVKIKTDMKVYHVPGFKEGLSISDMEGEVKANIEDFKGVQISPNYPWKIALSVVNDKGKDRKFFVHLEESEFEKA